MDENVKSAAVRRPSDKGENTSAPKPKATDRGRSDRVNLGDLSGLLGYFLRRAEVFAFQSFAAHLGPGASQVSEGEGISPGQLGVLLLVEANPGTNQTRIGKAIGIDRSTLVSMIDALETRGLIRREPSPTDRRSHALHLTDRGNDSGAGFLKKIRPLLNAHEAEIARNLSAPERAQLMTLLARVVTP